MTIRINLQGWADVCDVASALLYFLDVGLIDKDTPLTMSLFTALCVRYLREVAKEPITDEHLAAGIIKGFGISAPTRTGRHRVPKPKPSYDTIAVLRQAQRETESPYVQKLNEGDQIDIADIADLVESE